MAFMGLMVVGVVLLILGILAFLGVTALIIGIILALTKHKKSAVVLFIIAGILLGIVLILVIITVAPKPVNVDTPQGEATLMPSWCEKYNECLDEHNITKLEKLIDEHPDMIYYYDTNRVMLLDYGLYNCDIEIMQIALDHGAKFDEPLRYDHMVFYSSLDSFFAELDYPDWEKEPNELITDGETTDEMINAIKFAIDNGAKVRWNVNHDYQSDNFFDMTLNWIDKDGVISEKDIALLKVIADSDPEIEKLYVAWEKSLNAN